MFDKLFLRHPASVDETYGEHFVQAFGFSMAMLAGAVACFVHALIPGLFVGTGSGVIKRLHVRMVTHRTKAARQGLGVAAPADLNAFGQVDIG